MPSITIQTFHLEITPHVMVLITPHVAMVNIGTVVIIGTVFWWPWSTLAQWSSLAECYGGCDQH